jgi:hypothetical protein
MIKTNFFRVGLPVLLSIFLVVGLPISALGAGTFVDDDGNPHEAAIEAIAAAGITMGCNPPVNDRYCPSQAVTRGEMAAFLVRAFDLPNSVLDAFTDDDGSIFENDINALAAAGITTGCAPGLYCEYGLITREQMAALLARALALPPALSSDLFSDDNNSPFEDQIESLAEAGITNGCAPSQFCPTDSVLRDQMATFLARSLGLASTTSECTRVIGFSQTEEWFTAGDFEQVLPNGNWELLWQSGSSIEMWADPTYQGWDNAVLSGCTTGSPNRLLITISGASRPVGDWVTVIEQTVATARAKYPGVDQILLQPVVGGPGNSVCELQGERVRASENHPVIDEAITILTSAGSNDVVSGASPEVRQCQDYSDNLGHLVDSAEGPIGGAIAQFYLNMP